MRLRCTIYVKKYTARLYRGRLCARIIAGEKLASATRAARVFLIDYFKVAIPQEMDDRAEIKPAPRFLVLLLFYYLFLCGGAARSGAPLNYMVRHGCGRDYARWWKDPPGLQHR